MTRKLCTLAGVLAAACLGWPILWNQMDTFQDGTLQGWGGGAAPTNIATGGPFGAGDRYLRITTGFRAHLATHNVFQWSGDYTAAGVNVVQAFLKNEGSSELHMRVVVHGPTGSRWTSTVPVILPAGSGWRRVTFRLHESALTRVLGVDTYAATMANVDRLMFRHSTDLSSGGTTITGQLGIDRVHARWIGPRSP